VKNNLSIFCKTNNNIYLCSLLEVDYKKLKDIKMKQGIHPENYRLVAFKDMSNDVVFLAKSTVNAKETIEFEGVEYPVIKLEISNTSHPFYTGKMTLVDTAGRVDKFMNRYKKHMDGNKK
jgi:large subunit ribosomal protein L31